MSEAPPEPFVAFEPTERQAEILDHAFALIEESGLGRLTLRRVAERVGFTEAAIYRHFPNKAALVDALLRTLGGRLLGPIRAAAAERSLPPRERIERMVRHHVRLLRETRGLPILLVAEALATGEEAIVARMRSIIATYAGLLGDVLAELDLPLSEPPQRQALLFFGLPMALALQMRAWPGLGLDDRDVDELVTYSVRALTSGARPTSETEP